IRINAISPGATDTPLAQANKETWLGFGTDYRDAAGTKPFTPLEQAYPILFPCSDAAAAITGTIPHSRPRRPSPTTPETFPPGTMFAKILLGRSLWARTVRDVASRFSSRPGRKTPSSVPSGKA